MGGLRVTVVHNHYSGRVPSGEDLSVAQHAELLGGAAEVTVVGPSNESFLRRPLVARLDAAAATVGARPRVAMWRGVVADTRPDCVHVENAVPFVPEKLVADLVAAGLPVLRRWRSYRFRCVTGEAFRAGRPCEACSGAAGDLHAVVHGCYAGSRLASAVVAARRAPHRDGSPVLHVPTSQHLARQLEADGVPATAIRVVPNWVPEALEPPEPVEPLEGLDQNGRGVEVLFVGVLSERKGVGVLLDAWRRVPRSLGARLRLVGDGPMGPAARAAAAADASISVEGPLDYAATRARIAQAAVLVVPSVWEEPFGRVAAEGLAEGTPVVVSDRGGLPEVVDGSCGWRVAGADPTEWAETLTAVLSLPTADRQAVVARGRRRYEERYSPAAARTRWLDLYTEVVGVPT